MAGSPASPPAKMPIGCIPRRIGAGRTMSLTSSPGRAPTPTDLRPLVAMSHEIDCDLPRFATDTADGGRCGRPVATRGKLEKLSSVNG